MQKSKLTMLAMLMSPLLITGAANAANTTDISINTPKVDLQAPISSGQIDVDGIDEALEHLNGGGDGDGGGRS